jgi:2-hydroxy-6-oxonona-2,4-dienedioate hydrolase
MAYLDLDGGKLYYEVAGEGETLVLSHAGFVDSGMWDAQWETFAQHYRVIRFDMRGFGKSDPVTAPISRRDDLYALLNHLQVKQAVLLGCSMSGEIMLDFALEHPERVSKLILVSAVPSGFEMQGAPPADVMGMIAAFEQGDFDRASELQIRLWVDGPMRQPEQVNPIIRQRAAEMNQTPVKKMTWLMADAQPARLLNPPAATRLNEVHVPTLIIVGALDNGEILRAADVMFSEIEGAKKVIIPDTAHVPNMEKPAEFNQAVFEFFR